MTGQLRRQMEVIRLDECDDIEFDGDDLLLLNLVGRRRPEFLKQGWQRSGDRHNRQTTLNPAL
jgi:hypothetical protein